MQIKTFESANMTEALAKVRREFGPDAVILSARTVRKQSGLLGTLRKSVVELTAAKDEGDAKPNGAMSQGGFPEIAVDRRQRQRRLFAGMKKRRPTRRKNKEGADMDNSSERSAQTKKQATQAGQAVLQQLKKIGVSSGHSADIARQLTAETAEDPGGPMLGPLAAVLTRMKVVPEAAADDKAFARIHAFVGPTGTGKTTALVKLAAQAAVQRQQKVGILTLDMERIGALAQLEAYSRILGVPMEAAAEAEDIQAALERLDDCEQIFVDTQGVNPRSVKQLHDVRRSLRFVSADACYLVLSATTADDQVAAIIENYARYSLTGLIVSKMDEADCPGQMVNIALQAHLPLMYIGDGQQVPEDIQKADALSVARCLLPDSTPDRSQSSSVEDHAQNMNAAERQLAEGQNYLANVNSDIFHRPDCKWTLRIKPANCIAFASVSEARAKGFNPCRTCAPDKVEVDGENLTYNGRGQMQPPAMRTSGMG